MDNDLYLCSQLADQRLLSPSQDGQMLSFNLDIGGGVNYKIKSNKELYLGSDNVIREIILFSTNVNYFIKI